MEILLLLVGAAIGGLISWLISHAYYEKSGKDQALLFSKLSSDVRRAILEDNRDSLTVKELNKLLEEKTIDPARGGPLPYVACPKCGDENLRGGEIYDDRRDENYWIIKCEQCGWSDWTQ
ncbi:MAG TPA: hypothetical protein QF468_07250 [Nitrospinota bacterium]|nr:hypothetical protein [Nitrospinota bacterium]|tara:strand:- start:4940 stop:5299 length:360 start_codon:yes stop_codon:yes gene_type:complete